MEQNNSFDTEGNLYINPLTDFGFKRIFGDELQSYMDSVDAYRTTMAAFAFSEMKGEERGIAIGEERKNISNITRMRSKGLDDASIADFLDLPLEYVLQH